MTSRQLGEVLSALAPLAWAVAVILFRAGGERVGPVALNLFKNIVGLLLLGITLAALGQIWWAEAAVWDVAVLLASGVLGIAVADTLFFVALNRLGASRMAIVGSSYPVVVILLSLVFLGERFVAWQWVGAALVLGAVVLASLPDRPAAGAKASGGGSGAREALVGTLVGLAAIALMAAGIVMAKPVLDHAPVVWSSAIRLTGGAAVLLVYCSIHPRRRTFFEPLRPSRDWRTILPGAVIGTYLAYMLWLAGIKYAPVSIAAVLNQLHVIYTVVLAALFLRERMTPRKLLAVGLAVGGSAMVVLWNADEERGPASGEEVLDGEVGLVLPAELTLEPQVADVARCPAQGLVHAGQTAEVEGVHAVDLEQPIPRRNAAVVGRGRWGQDVLHGEAALAPGDLDPHPHPAVDPGPHRIHRP